MADGKGWVKIHRKIMEGPLWLAEPFTRAQAWIDLILLANHKTSHVRKRGILIEIERGQVGYGEEALAVRWRWSRGKARRFLNELKTVNAITRKTVHQNPKLSSLITLTNYEQYQSDETTNGTTSGTMNKNDKNERKNTHAQLLRESEAFGLFWSRYPKKRNRLDAYRAWAKIKPDGRLLNKILAGLESAIQSDEWGKEGGRFIPYAAKWLRGEGWKDEYDEVTSYY